MKFKIYIIDRTSRQHTFMIPESGLTLEFKGETYSITDDTLCMAEFKEALVTSTPFTLSSEYGTTTFNPVHLIGVQAVHQ